MSKQVIVLLLIAVVAFAQPHPRGDFRPQDGKQLSGAYHKSSEEEVGLLRTAGPFMEIEKAARDFYLKHTGNNLGDVVSIQKQIVSGINFKITFGAAPGNVAQTVEIIVYAVPWARTIQIVSVLPAITDVTDSTGKILPEITQN